MSGSFDIVYSNSISVLTALERGIDLRTSATWSDGGARAVFHMKPDIAGGLTGGPAAAVGRISARNNAGCASPQPRRSWDVARGYQKAAQIVRGPLSCAHPEIVTGSPDLFASGLPAGDQSAL